MQRVANSLPVVLAIFLALLPANTASRQITNGIRSERITLGAATSSTNVNPAILSRTVRRLPSDLEVSGDVAGTHGETARYISRDDLLTLPEVTFTVTGDTNFTGATKISGVRLEDLVKRLASAPTADLVVAVCDDQYHANYPRDYMAAHHPVLVLNVNGKPPSGWPKDSEEHSFDMGPYMISHPNFTPSFKILSHSDEPQIPWGVVRIEFQNEKAVFAAIAPLGPHAAEPDVQAGYRIARQNCLRCHNMGKVGGLKSGVPWTALARSATTSPELFAAYIHDPQQRNSKAQMPGNPDYDTPTLGALASYFNTFTLREK